MLTRGIDKLCHNFSGERGKLIFIQSLTKPTLTQGHFIGGGWASHESRLMRSHLKKILDPTGISHFGGSSGAQQWTRPCEEGIALGAGVKVLFVFQQSECRFPRLRWGGKDSDSIKVHFYTPPIWLISLFVSQVPQQFPCLAGYFLSFT